MGTWIGVIIGSVLR